MLNWFSSWSPEHIVGLVTAVAGVIAAIVMKGKYRASSNPPTDREMMASVRMHPTDLLIIKQLEKDLKELHDEMRLMQGVLGQIATDTAVIRDRNKTP